MRMKRQGALDAVVLEQVFAFAHLFENFGGKIFPVEQDAELGFVEGGILEKREQDVRGMVMNECCEVVAGGGDRLFSIGVAFGAVHSTSLRTAGLSPASQPGSWTPK